MSTQVEENLTHRFPATVAEVVDSYTLVINRGIRDGVKIGQPFLIYSAGDREIIDPETRESLGVLELVKGQGEVISVQEKLAVVRSSKWKKVNPGSIDIFLQNLTRPPDVSPLKDAVLEMFREVKIGDKARPI